MKNKIKGVKVVRQLEHHNVAVLKKRFDHFNIPGIKRYEVLAGVLLEQNEPKYSKLEIGAALLPPKYLHPTTLMMSQTGKNVLTAMFNGINHDKYKIKFPMLQLYTIIFTDEPDERGISRGSYLVTPMTRKTIPEVVKRLTREYEGLGMALDGLDNLYSTDRRTVVKEFKMYHGRIELKRIRANAYSKNRGVN